MRWWASFRRVAIAVLVAVPATALVAALLSLVPPWAALAIGVCGLVSFQFGKEFGRPVLVAVGGLSMFAGVLSWALRQ